MKKRILLFDLDHTLLDFEASERKGLTQCFAEFGLQFDDEVRDWYLARNQELWAEYECGKITREDIFKQRFPDTFAHFAYEADGNLMEEAYRNALSKGCDLIAHAMEVVQAFHKTHELYIVTNGLNSTQVRRIRESGLQPYFKDIFISEGMGMQKPMKEYFDYCFERIENFCHADSIIIGDSLSSDIQGGQNAGIDTCWFNPKKVENKTPYQPTLEVADLRELLELIS